MSTTKTKPTGSRPATKAPAKPQAPKAADTTEATSAAAATKASKRASHGTRWTEEQVALLMDTVKSSATLKEAFEAVATQLGKSTNTVQQKYYNLKRGAGGGRAKAKRASTKARAKATAAASTVSRKVTGSTTPNATELRDLQVDELVDLAKRVKAEVDRRRRELDAASKHLAG